MSTYESDPAGLGVGKRYGALEAGGIGGRIGGVDASQQVQFMVKAGEDDGLSAQELPLPAYARITKVEANVIAAYAASSTIAVTLDGNDVLDVSDVDGTAVGYVDETLTATAADLLVGATPEVLKVVPNANALASATGEAVITVTYTTA